MAEFSVVADDDVGNTLLLLMMMAIDNSTDMAVAAGVVDLLLAE